MPLSTPYINQINYINNYNNTNNSNTIKYKSTNTNNKCYIGKTRKLNLNNSNTTRNVSNYNYTF